MKKIFSLNKIESLNLFLIKIIIVVLCSFSILTQLSCKKQTPPPSQTTRSQSETSSEPKPPDLSKCTRIEMKFYPSTKEYICMRSYRENLFNSQEIEYFDSIDKIVIADPKIIKVFSEDVSSSTFEKKVNGLPGIGNYIGLDCYYKDATKTHIMVYPSHSNYTMILVNDTYEFISKIDLNLLSPDIQKYILRDFCAHNLKINILKSFYSYSKEKKLYPLPSEWCDSIIEYYKNRGFSLNVSEFERALTCPSKADARCSYAMNPNCKSDSPSDMVLLFETKDGWNQYGGSELFTFENHEPKGGCVLLNDGTVKFIRTEEELNSLRWK